MLYQKKIAEPPHMVFHAAGSAACRETMPSSERLWLTVDTSPLHGSSALFLLLHYGSNHTTTICSSGSWQCESWVKMLHDNLSAVSLLDSWRSQLLAHSSFWDLNKPVWLTKWAPYDVPTPPPAFTRPEGLHAIIKRTHLDKSNLMSILQQLPSTLPQPLHQVGVGLVRMAVVMMHRPWCLWPLSRSATASRRQNISAWASSELDSMEELVARYNRHRMVGRPVLMLNYADLVWNMEEVAKQLFTFTPCLGQLRTYESPPVAHGDRNKLVMHTGSFGSMRKQDSHSCCAYNKSRSSCIAKATALYAGLDHARRRRAAQLESYLHHAMGTNAVTSVRIRHNKR